MTMNIDGYRYGYGYDTMKPSYFRILPPLPVAECGGHWIHKNRMVIWSAKCYSLNTIAIAKRLKVRNLLLADLRWRFPGTGGKFGRRTGKLHPWQDLEVGIIGMRQTQRLTAPYLSLKANTCLTYKVCANTHRSTAIVILRSFFVAAKRAGYVGSVWVTGRPRPWVKRGCSKLA